VRLFEAKDYSGALAVFNDAYKKFSSAKILLNIGTTLKQLDRRADAANAYQHYLDSSDADPAKRSMVKAELVELDKTVGRVALVVTPGDAEVQVGNDWVVAGKAKLVRVNPGTAVMRARRDGYQPLEQPVQVAAGAEVAATLALVAIPKPVAKQVIVTVHDGLGVRVVPEGPRTRYGGFAMAHVSVVPKLGSAWLVGGTADITTKLSADLAIMLGPGLVSSGAMEYPAPPPKLGVYAGASYAFRTSQLRPRASAGIPIFFSDGARLSVRAAGGVEYVASRHLSMIVDVGLEEAINPQDDIRRIAVVPALAAIGRL
jgi:hypothetical protein